MRIVCEVLAMIRIINLVGFILLLTSPILLIYSCS